MSINNLESETKMFQVSTLQALALGYSRQVIRRCIHNANLRLLLQTFPIKSLQKVCTRVTFTMIF